MSKQVPAATVVCAACAPSVATARNQFQVSLYSIVSRLNSFCGNRQADRRTYCERGKTHSPHHVCEHLTELRGDWGWNEINSSRWRRAMLRSSSGTPIATRVSHTL